MIDIGPLRKTAKGAILQYHQGQYDMYSAGNPTSGQFLQANSSGLWVPHTLVAGDIPQLAHSSLSGLTTGDDHTQYLKESDFDDIDFLVGTATGHTGAEIVVGTTPGGELGGTWASPTVDATHSGSAHHNQVHGHADHDNRTRRLWLPAQEVAADGEWIAAVGTPDFAQRNSLYGAIAFDSASTEAVISMRTVMIPDDYVSGLTIYLVWTNLGAGSGDVVWRVGHSVATDGIAFPSLTTDDETITAPAQNVNKYSVFTALTPSVAAGYMVNLSCGRIGGDAADTLANDAGFVGYLMLYTADM